VLRIEGGNARIMRRRISGVGWVEERNPTFFEYHERLSLGFAFRLGQPNLNSQTTRA